MNRPAAISALSAAAVVTAWSAALLCCGVDFMEPIPAGANRPPSIAPIPDQTVEQGKTITVQVFASDPDGEPPCLFADISGLGNLATFTDEGGGNARFSFTPDFVFSKADNPVGVRTAACDRTICSALSVPFPAEDSFCSGSMRAEASFNIEKAAGSIISGGSGESTILMDRFLSNPPPFYGLFGAQMRFSRDTEPGPIETNWQRETALLGRMLITAPGAGAVVVMRVTPKCVISDEPGNFISCTAGYDCPDQAECSVLNEKFYYELNENPVVWTFPWALFSSYSPGLAIGPLVDVDGDQIADLIGSASDASERNGDLFSPPCNGHVLIFPGKEDGSFSQEPIVLDAPETPSSGCNAFGASLDAGDLDGDGIADLVVGAPGGQDLMGGCMPGRVYLYLSSRGAIGTSDPVRVVPDDENPCDDPSYRAGSGFSKAHPSNSFGYAVRVLNVSWGAPLFVVGAPAAVGEIVVDRGTETEQKYFVQRGQVTVFNFSRQQNKAYLASTIDDAIPEVLSLFGMSVAVGGVEAGDGVVIMWIVAGSPGARLLSGKAQISVFYYKDGLLFTEEQVQYLPIAAPQPERGAMFGFAVDTLLTLGSNFQIMPGFVVSAPRSSTGGKPSSGAVYLFPLLDSTGLPPLVSTMLPPEPEEDSLFGYSIAALSDSLFVGAPLSSVAQTKIMQGRVIFFPPGL